MPRGRAPAAQPAAVSTPAPPTERLYFVRARDIWAFVKTQPTSFWMINSYLFFEYVRPQQIYRSIDVLPFAWTSIIIAAFAFLGEGGKFRKRYVADAWLIAFSAMVLISSFLAQQPGIAFSSLWDTYFTWIVIYLLITNIITNERRFIVFMLAFLLYSTKMSQHGFRTFTERGGGFASYGATGAPGWFQNSGEFGIQMCIFIPLSLYFIQSFRAYWPKWKVIVFLFMPISALISIVASSSRGAVLGLAGILLWLTAKSKKRMRGLVLLALAAGATWVLLPQEQKTRFSEMGTDDTSRTRLIYWKRGLDIMHNYPLTGVGFKNWFSYTSRHYPMLIGNGGERYNQLPHNILIEVGSELGYPGLLLFFGLVGATWYTNFKTRKAARQLGANGRFAINMAHGLDVAVVGYIIGGFFVTVFYYPFFWINFAFTVALHHSTVNRLQPTAVIPQPARSRGSVALHGTG